MVELAKSTVPTALSKQDKDHNFKANVQKVLEAPFVKQHVL